MICDAGRGRKASTRRRRNGRERGRGGGVCRFGLTRERGGPSFFFCRILFSVFFLLLVLFSFYFVVLFWSVFFLPVCFFFAVFIRFLFFRCFFFCPIRFFFARFLFRFFHPVFYLIQSVVRCCRRTKPYSGRHFDPSPYAFSPPIDRFPMRFLLQLIAKIDSPPLSSFFSHFPSQFGLQFANYARPTFLSHFVNSFRFRENRKRRSSGSKFKRKGRK